MIDLVVLITTKLNLVYLPLYIVLSIITFFAISKLIVNTYYVLRRKQFDKHSIEYLERLSCASGVPRCGKTSSRYYVAVRLARWNWKMLQREYWVVMNRPRETWSKHITSHEKEIIDAYNFFIKSPYLPCLYAWDACQVGKRFCHSLTMKMLMLKERVPYRSVLFVDEIGNLFPADKGPPAKKLLPICETGRFVGHYFDGYFIFTEQSPTGFMAQLRNLTGSFIYFTKKQKWVHKPWLLTAIYELIYSFIDFDMWNLSLYKHNTRSYIKIYNSVKTSSKRLAKFMRTLGSLIKNVGFRKYTYKELVSEQNPDKSDCEKGVFYLPSTLNCKYNDRSRAETYPCKDMDLQLHGFSSLIKSVSELEKQIEES